MQTLFRKNPSRHLGNLDLNQKPVSYQTKVTKNNKGCHSLQQKSNNTEVVKLLSIPEYRQVSSLKKA